jgi:hypothetical protein
VGSVFEGVLHPNSFPRAVDHEIGFSSVCPCSFSRLKGGFWKDPRFEHRLSAKIMGSEQAGKTEDCSDQNATDFEFFRDRCTTDAWRLVIIESDDADRSRRLHGSAENSGRTRLLPRLEIGTVCRTC